MKWFLLPLLACLVGAGRAQQVGNPKPAAVPASPFRAVFGTDEDVKKLGGYPIPRRHYAEALFAAKRAGARAVILKFFFDRPGKNAADDELLARAIRDCGIPVVLQARIDDTEKNPNPLAARFVRNDLPSPRNAIGGRSGWLPLPMLAEGAHAVAFMDGLNPAPMIEMYQGRPMPSLFLVALELALGKAEWSEKGVQFNGVTMPLQNGDITVPFPARDDSRWTSLSALLAGEADEALRGAIVVIGYDGQAMHTFPTPIGPIKAHRLFFLQLELAYRSFSKRGE